MATLTCTDYFMSRIHVSPEEYPKCPSSFLRPPRWYHNSPVVRLHCLKFLLLFFISIMAPHSYPSIPSYPLLVPRRLFRFDTTPSQFLSDLQKVSHLEEMAETHFCSSFLDTQYKSAYALTSCSVTRSYVKQATDRSKGEEGKRTDQNATASQSPESTVFDALYPSARGTAGVRSSGRRSRLCLDLALLLHPLRNWCSGLWY